MSGNEPSRRAFLARIGVLGAGTLLLPRCLGPESIGSGAGAGELELAALIDLLRPVFGQLTRDTLNGFIAFVVPGHDVYSRAQGTPRSEPGGIDAGGTDFLFESLDRLPFPEHAVRPAASALITALAELPLPLPGELLGGILGPPLATIDLIGDAVLFAVENDGATPLSLPTALLLNYAATVVNPTTLRGPLLSPFARLSFAEKAHAMEMLETTQSQLIALIDTQVPEPLRPSVAGLLQFLGGGLHEFAAVGSFGEPPRRAPATRSLARAAVDWRYTGRLPDAIAGDAWDDVRPTTPGR